MEYTKGERKVYTQTLPDGTKQFEVGTILYHHPAIAVFDREADAILDSAAPEMYEALYDAWENISYWLANFEDKDHKTLCDDTRIKLDNIKKALAKAEGK